ncbi:hypothetical protein MNBD_GAMMA23-1527 [hydrothermal vent metagenome]|uniref:Response regulatory domain-containing protein n=1 Tax=hydrothermal vent metagenome TaxID=652676 RepID=A0A3B1AJH4_9ZZZZ
MSKFKILSVDDEPTNQLVIDEILEDDYEVKLVYTGEECLETVKTFSPNLILLDINMPGIDGYDTCLKLKENSETRNIPVIFLSALTSTEEKLKGYEVGADDYIPKPFDHEDLLNKIKNILSDNLSAPVAAPMKGKDKEDKENEELLKELQSSRSVAMEAMRYTSDLGAVVKFYEDSARCKTFDELMQAVFVTITGLSLNCSMQIRDGSEVFNKSSGGDISPMEVSVLDVSKDKGRFFDFNARTIMNYKHSSILIKNMPIDDDKRYGVMKDILGALGNGAEERVRTIILERAVVSNREQVIALIRETFKSINYQHVLRSREGLELMESMIKDVHKTIESMDLLSYQEEQLESIIESFRQRNDIHANAGVDLTDASEAALASLNSIFEVLE